LDLRFHVAERILLHLHFDYPLSGPAREAAEDAKARAAENDPLGLLAPRFTAHVPVPTQQDVQEALLRKRKLEFKV